MKDRFVNLLRETQRPGIENVITYLSEKTDFFTAPASTQYHGAKEGGLLEHSLAVFDNLTKLAPLYLADKQDSIAITALLHDLCKANFYKVEMRNKKDPIVDGKQLTGWHSLPFYAIDDQIPLGHGEKSVIILQQMIRLTLEEVMAIRWHMGLSDTDYATRQVMSKAFNGHPLAVALHLADLAACYFDKK
ncbi:HD domain-containing protein [Sporomusa sphaeroides]|uniref:HD domain-containing protein n=1 Tax=Sporomusa sphaeroides DSM 2875 TaxID=1337886 RepID=A0ABM9W000_9FIRM|nr:HD domain-containing protein [Sporomusa sphaeroides]OLS56401.1 hypothetical protein SPSPH_27940 [Sporomusa sphaeroides DSM 2875]CVK18496.1 hypothetical protein SSPH_01134 [Sporomusa sphaeroides DSM 2875]